MKLDRQGGVSLIVGQNEVGVRWDNTDVRRKQRRSGTGWCSTRWENRLGWAVMAVRC